MKSLSRIVSRVSLSTLALCLSLPIATVLGQGNLPFTEKVLVPSAYADEPLVAVDALRQELNHDDGSSANDIEGLEDGLDKEEIDKAVDSEKDGFAVESSSNQNELISSDFVDVLVSDDVSTETPDAEIENGRETDLPNQSDADSENDAFDLTEYGDVVSETSEGYLIKDETGFRFFDTEGQSVSSSFLSVGSARYYFGQDGYAVSGLQKIEGRLYRFDDQSCAMVTGWCTWEDNSRSYFHPSNGGSACKGWWTLGGKRYYFDSATGRTVTGAQEVSGKLYSFASDGSVQYGMKKWEDGSLSYFARDLKGAAAAARWTISGKVYYFDPATHLAVTGWMAWDDGSRSFFSPNRNYAAATGKWNVDGLVYFFDPQNRCTSITGWHTWSSGRRSYFIPSRNGSAAVGWWSLGGKRYYFLPSSRETLKGKQTVSGSVYYFNSNGSMHKGWVAWNGGTISFFGSDGIMYTGYHVVQGVGCDFGKSGKAPVTTKVRMVYRAQKCSSNTDYLLMVDTNHCYVGVFKRAGSSWALNRYWRCTTGAPGSSWTPSGTFSTGYKGYVFGHGYSCYWYTQFNKAVLFHSITYYENTHVVLDGRLGVNVSNGCVRLNINNAKWIYDNIPRSTTVRVYRG